jgi:hypothetical protein
MQTAANRPQSGLWPVFGQISASESEEKKSKMKENERKTAFICFHNFSESGHFNGLRPIQIKKVFPFEPEANAKSHFGAAA